MQPTFSQNHGACMVADTKYRKRCSSDEISFPGKKTCVLLTWQLPRVHSKDIHAWIYVVPWKSIQLNGTRCYHVVSKCRTGMAPHRNREFYGPKRVLLAGKDFGNRSTRTVYRH